MILTSHISHFTNTTGYNAESNVQLLANTSKGLFRVVARTMAAMDVNEVTVLRWTNEGFSLVIVYPLSHFTDVTYRSGDTTKREGLALAAEMALSSVQDLDFAV